MRSSQRPIATNAKQLLCLNDKEATNPSKTSSSQVTRENTSGEKQQSLPFFFQNVVLKCNEHSRNQNQRRQNYIFKAKGIVKEVIEQSLKATSKRLRWQEKCLRMQAKPVTLHKVQPRPMNSQTRKLVKQCGKRHPRIQREQHQSKCSRASVRWVP